VPEGKIHFVSLRYFALSGIKIDDDPGTNPKNKNIKYEI
jgi:hypothetical protein